MCRLDKWHNLRSHGQVKVVNRVGYYQEGRERVGGIGERGGGKESVEGLRKRSIIFTCDK